jgi:signal recognition particle GTPase
MGQIKKILELIEQYENMPLVHKEPIKQEMEELKKIVNYKTKKELENEGIQKSPPNCS